MFEVFFFDLKQAGGWKVLKWDFNDILNTNLKRKLLLGNSGSKKKGPFKKFEGLCASFLSYLILISKWHLDNIIFEY